MKKWLVVYSSNTGNTKRVAEAMLEALPEEAAICSVKEAVSLEEYDVVAAGYWVKRGRPNPEMQKFLARLHDQHVALFQTLGADAGSEHAVTSLARAAYMLGENCRILGTFSCRGRINPALLERRKTLPREHPHHYSEANAKRWAAAASHPDSADLDRARAFIENMQNKLVIWERQQALKPTK